MRSIAQLSGPNRAARKYASLDSITILESALDKLTRKLRMLKSRVPAKATIFSG